MLTPVILVRLRAAAGTREDVWNIRPSFAEAKHIRGTEMGEEGQSGEAEHTRRADRPPPSNEKQPLARVGGSGGSDVLTIPVVGIKWIC